tara:strand:- start:191 stop:754 length:564 start_codon:yes stop_codon:yes gene_type:complete
MALVTPVITVNPQTGAPINTVTVDTAHDLITGVGLRRYMCAGAYKYTDFTLSLTVADGSQATATIPAGDPTPIAGKGATMTIESSTITSTTYTEGIDFTLSGKTITFTTPYTGNNKVTTITFDYYDTDAANLVYDVPVYASNTMGTMTMGGVDIILWNEGILAQSVHCWLTTGTVNGVISALFTDKN